MDTKYIILASASPRRREILSSFGVEFEVIKSDVEEICDSIDPGEYSVRVASIKAHDVKNKSGRQYGLIISADTIVYADKILGKPQNREDAKNMLSLLDDSTHQVYTGVCVIDLENETEFSFYEKTDVVFYKLSDDEIDEYITTGECDDKAGAYAIQGLASVFVKEIRGDYNNVVGFPLSRLYQECKKRGIDIKHV